MYIIELIYKKFFEKKTQKAPPDLEAANLNVQDELEDVNTCKHIFLPIDSTKKILACSKCGFVVKAEDLQKHRNFFLR